MGHTELKVGFRNEVAHGRCVGSQWTHIKHNQWACNFRFVASDLFNGKTYGARKMIPHVLTASKETARKREAVLRSVGTVDHKQSKLVGR